jgi:phosphopantothenoylcysteine decarboxylase/phosphopantothenate--cysteine ligase
MWAKPSVSRNIDILRNDSYTVIEPGVGTMACGDVGVGRLPDEHILLDALAHAKPATSP